MRKVLLPNLQLKAIISPKEKSADYEKLFLPDEAV